MSRRRHSLFWRLLVTVVAVGIAINLVVAGGFRFAMTEHQPLKRAGMKNLGQYAEYLVADLGTPPSEARARELAEELELTIRTEGPQANWSTDPAAPTFADIETHRERFRSARHADRPMGRYAGRFFFILERGPQRYLLLAPEGTPFEPRWEVVALLLGALTLLLAALWGMLRHALRPVRQLMLGVQEVSKGNLDVQVPARRHDEFGRLARAFNRMAASVRDMVRSREQLLLDVSHELRSPLTRMRVGLEYVPEGKTRDQLAEEIVLMESMIGELLEDARLDSPSGGLRRKVVNVTMLVEEIAPRHPGLRLLTPSDPLIAEVDEARVAMVVNNLLDNADKHGGAGQVCAELRQRADTIVFEVRDEGPGIPAAEIEKVFEPFYRVDRARTPGAGGFGLGLSLSRKIARAHGGDLVIESIEGKGTTARLTLPTRNV